MSVAERESECGGERVSVGERVGERELSECGRESECVWERESVGERERE